MLWLALGAALIIGSALYITRRESALARHAQPAKPEEPSAASSGPGDRPNSR
jgi:hypothetical protein